MNKKEIKDGVKYIQTAIKEFKENYPTQLKPVKDIKEHIEKIMSIEENTSIDLEICWENLEAKAIRDIISDSEYYTNIEEQMDCLISDLEDWSSDVSETKVEHIQEQYIEPLEELKDLCPVDEIECIEDIENMISDLENGLNEYLD